ncbi:MAG: CvpA family protein [Candidatus Cyclobacteriaceae bacterium M2_1C_046]
MNITDIIILVLLAIGAYRGFTKGFLLEIVGILALLLGIFGAIFLLQEGMVYMKDHFEIGNNILPYVTFLLLFILIIIGVNLLGRLVKKILDLTLLGTIDNFAGALVGAFKWALAISFILWASTSFGIYFFEEEKTDSQLFSYIADLAPWIVEKVKALAPGFDEVPTYST